MSAEPVTPTPTPFFFQPSWVKLRKVYNRQRFVRDVGAGLAVRIVALPLAMAFAIAKGLNPRPGCSPPSLPVC